MPADDSVPQVGRQGGFLVSRLHHLGGRVFERLLREAGLADLTAARGRIVFALMRQDGIAQNELAELVKLDKSGLALTLKELERDGIVRRTRASHDARVSLVWRTERFTQLSARFNQVSARMNELYYQGLEEKEISQFEGMLNRILTNLEQSPDSSYTGETPPHFAIDR